MTYTTDPTIELLCLADFVAELRRVTGAPVTYSKAQRAVLDGKIKIAKREGGKCLVNRGEVPAAATALGLTLPSAA